MPSGECSLYNLDIQLTNEALAQKGPGNLTSGWKYRLYRMYAGAYVAVCFEDSKLIISLLVVDSIPPNNM